MGNESEFMVEQFELLLLGVSVVIDSVLLMILLERVNRLNSAVWLTTLVLATWVVHACGFCHLLVRQSEVDPLVLLDRTSLLGMGAALLVMPSAMVHAAVRVNHTGHILRQKIDVRYALLYLPFFAFPWVVAQVLQTEDRSVPGCFGKAVAWYVVELAIANAISAVLFLRYRASITGKGARSFFLRLVLTLAGVSGITITYLFLSSSELWEPIFGLMSILTPLSLAMLFLWYTMQERILPLVIERSLAYGAMFVFAILLHQVWIVPFAERMQRKSNLDIILIEGIVVVGLILVWRPFRERSLEALRYLLSHNVFRIRQSLRQISLQLAQQESSSLAELHAWFIKRVAETLEVDNVSIWFSPSVEEIELPECIDAVSMEKLVTWLKQKGRFEVAPGDLDDIGIASELQAKNIFHLFRCQFKDLLGLVFIGNRQRGESFSEEQRAAITMLFDQYAATISNKRMEQVRLQHERQASQQEKLAVLGLMAGSLAHEIKNPLSSIRTVATLLREDLGTQSAHATDLRIILEEIDRLTTTTQRLLDYSKPPDEKTIGVLPSKTVNRLLHILAPWANQQKVALIQDHLDSELLVAATDAALSEVLFNVIRNAIEAAQGSPSASVWISTHIDDKTWIASIRDNGPGVDSALLDTIFEPFVSSKQTGTGLGLYIAAQRVRSMKGTIQCQSSNQGTTFEVRLPLHNSPQCQ